MKNKSLIIVVVGVLIVGAVAFYAGMKYQQSQRGQFFRQFSNSQGGQNNQMRGRMGFRPVAGEIISKDDTSITVKLQDGSSKIILLTDGTSYNRSSEGSKTDLKAGERVAVFGMENSDGSVTAQNIELNLVFRTDRVGRQ